VSETQQPGDDPATIRRVLIADRGAIARRVIRTCRALGIETVAIHDDADAALPHVAEADLAVRLVADGDRPTGTPADRPSVAQVIDAARRSGADAVHPGDAAQAMSAELAAAVRADAMTWVGLPAASILAVRSRIDARERVRTADVAALAAIDVTGMDRVELLSSAERIGLPLVVKPIAAGGDGDLARRVDAMIDVEPTVVTTSRDATGELDDGRLFLERHVDDGRHLCVPVIADATGAGVALLEWETTTRRGDLPELTESPSPAVDRSLRRQLRSAAVAAARALDCVGLVTVEFVLTGEGLLRFLHVTSGFTPEHLAAELATGLDLVALQLASAEGRPLTMGARRPVVRGHAVAMRVVPLERPARFDRFSIHPPAPVDGLTPAAHVGVESALPDDAAVEVPEWLDVLAGVVVVAPDRAGAVRLATAALTRARLHGTPTNRDRLLGALHRPAGDSDGPADPAPAELSATPAVLAAAAVSVDTVEPPPDAPGRRVVELADHRVAWRLDDRGDVTELVVDGDPLVATVASTSAADGTREVTITIDGVRGAFLVRVTPSIVYVDGPHGSFALAREPALTTGWAPPTGPPVAVHPPPRAISPQPAR
jgi:propionyl-CoA carboxylase alpha chain